VAHLKRLELHGFKSFAQRSSLEFSPGITAIVGPNGSGKSNIADAIRWVLGEQSMRQLRGKKSDDIIFAGGAGRATAQMAQVGLVLDNTAAWIPSEFAEVTVARRAFRSGESEYLSNGTRVRLRDVLLLLAQARIGHDSYTVIGQGMVDQALSLRADERRALFEDAAGIRQFQAQRNDAEQKLTLTQSNLARLRDIIGEIEPRLAPLAEQARRAREFTGTRDELTRLLRVWYRRQWRDLLLAWAGAEATEAGHAARIQELQAALASEDAAAHELRDERETLLGELAALRRERGETSGRLQGTERDLAVARERLTSLERQQTDLEAEQAQQAETIEVAQAHIETILAQAAAAEDEADEGARAVESFESDQHAARLTQEREEARLRAAQRDVIQTQARLGAAQTELGRLQKQLGERNRALAARRDAVAQAQRTFEAASAQVEQRRAAFEAARDEVAAVVAQREQLAQEIADGQREIERLRAAVGDADRARHAAADRLALLEEWRRTLEGYSDGVRALLNAPADERPPIIGAVAQLASAPAGLETALEAALGVFAQAVLVATPDDARAAADWLRASGAGHALFVWLADAPSSSTPTDTSDPSLPQPDGVETFGYARDLLACPAEARATLAALLGETYVVRDLAVAERLALTPSPSPEGGGEMSFVTVGGEALYPQGWLRGGGVRVGEASAEGDVGSAVPQTAPGNEKDGARDAARDGRDGKGRQRGGQAQAAQAATTQATAAQTVGRQAQAVSALARERELRQLPGEIERMVGEIAELRAQQEAAVAVQRERQTRDEQLKRDAARLEATAQELARVVATTQREQERAQSERSLGEAMAEQMAAEAQGIEQEVAATQERVVEQERAQFDASERVEDIQAEVDELLAANRSQVEELTRRRTALALKRQEAKTLAQRAEQLRAQTREVEAQITRRAARLRDVQAQRTQLGVSIAAYEEDGASLRDRIRELGDELRAREERQASLERDLSALEHEQSAEREELARLEVEYRRSGVETQRARQAIVALARQIREELGGESGASDERDAGKAAPATANAQDGAATAAGADGQAAAHDARGGVSDYVRSHLDGDQTIAQDGAEQNGDGGDSSDGRDDGDEAADEIMPRGAHDPLALVVGGAAGDDEDGAPDEAAALSPEELTKMRRQIDHLRARLKGLGGYDPEAPQLYLELKTRYDFLTGQVNDMEQASLNLRTIIAELDATMRRQFVETFHAVNERFQRHFTTLFSGGAARLELTTPRRDQSDDDEDVDAEAQAVEPQGMPKRTNFGGIEVFVQIPGKRVQDLSLLSGGERAMVSAALLFALLETNPPPFCLLDEVDAALDEANVVRFCEILKTLAQSTQFIVITHNRVTMTHADTIYGVSMGPDSVSRILSMRLAEVSAAR